MEFEKFGFYTVDIDYLKYLHDIDSEVYYVNSSSYVGKPFLGVLIATEEFKYLIPFTSAKVKHKNLSLSDINRGHLLVYETITEEEIKENDVVKEVGDDKLRLLALLDIKKMIPVTDEVISYLNFDNVDEISYRVLLIKEYEFVEERKERILEIAEKTYSEQKEENVIKRFHCDFTKLEEACLKYNEVTDEEEIKNKEDAQ